MTVYRPFTEKLGGSDPATFVGNYGELFYNAETQQVYISDGVTVGGVPIAGGGGGVQSLITNGVKSLSFDDSNNISINTSIIPDNNSAYDIGSAEYKIRHLYLSSNSLTIGDTSLSEENFIKRVELDGELAPNSSTQPGRKGDIRVDAQYLYICVGDTQWVRVILENTW